MLLKCSIFGVAAPAVSLEKTTDIVPKVDDVVMPTVDDVVMPVEPVPSTPAPGVEDGKNLLTVFKDHLTVPTISKWVAGNPDPCYTLCVTCDAGWASVRCDKPAKTRVEGVSLVDSGLTGMISLNALKNMDYIMDFGLASNKLSGGLDLTVLPYQLAKFTVWTNKFNGTVDLTKFPPMLVFLDLATNEFSGEVDLTKLPLGLKKLFLDNNQFSGRLDMSALPEPLVEIALYSNQFSGTLDLTMLKPTVVHVKMQANSFNRMDLPKKAWPHLQTMKLMVREGWGESVCFLTPLDVSMVAHHDVPDVPDQRLCFPSAPNTSTPAPTQPMLRTPRPTPVPSEDMDDSKSNVTVAVVSHGHHDDHGASQNNTSQLMGGFLLLGVLGACFAAYKYNDQTEDDDVITGSLGDTLDHGEDEEALAALGEPAGSEPVAYVQVVEDGAEGE